MNKLRSASITFAIIATLTLAACSREAPPPSAEQQAQSEAPASETSAQVNAQTFSIGEFTGVALRDGGLEFPNDNKIVGVGKTPEEIAQLLSAAGLPTDKLSLNIQPLLVKTTDRVLLFDTGAGANFGPSAGGLMKSMSEAGVDAESVTDVFVSHPHGDHVGGLVTAEGALAFPNATIHIAAADWAFLEGLDAETASSIGLSNYESQVAAMAPKVNAFKPSAELLPGVVKAVEIRGHTPGHSGFLIGSGDSSLLYIGDSMHHHIVSVQKPDWTIAFDRDAPTAEKSRAELIAQSAANGQRIYAVHFPYPGLGKFEKRDDSYVWVAE